MLPFYNNHNENYLKFEVIFWKDLKTNNRPNFLWD